MKLSLLIALSVISVAAFAQGVKPMSKEDAAFLKKANEMTILSEGKQVCDKTSATQAVAKGEPGCCEAVGAKKTHKLFVAGQGYLLFSCPDQAAERRKALVAKGKKVGPVQRIVTGR